MSTIMKTHMRTAAVNDIPHLIALKGEEYDQYTHHSKFSPYIAERYIHTMMLDPDAVIIVIVGEDDVPFGYLSGTIDHLTLSDKPIAISHHWYVHNPVGQYKYDSSRYNHGLKLLGAFEGWAKKKGAVSTIVGLRQKAGERKTYDRVFNELGYTPDMMYYKKRMQ